jgi:DNA-binding MarR family transcriptional regulator
MMLMNIAATNTTLTATFSLIRARIDLLSAFVVRALEEAPHNEYPQHIAMKTLRPDTGSATVDAILHAAHRVRQAVDAELRAQGLSLSSYKVLRALDLEARSMRALSDVLRVAPRTITDIVDGLEKRGLAERSAHPHDRRVTVIRITVDGSEQLRHARRTVERPVTASVGSLTGSEQATLVALLERVDPAGGAAAVPEADSAAGV